MIDYGAIRSRAGRLFAIGLVAVTSFAHAAPALRRSEGTLAILPTASDTLRVMATIVSDPHPEGFDSTVTTLRIIDRYRNVQWAETLSADPDTAQHLGDEWSADVQVVSSSKGPAIMLERGYDPSYPGWGDCRYFALRGDRLMPVTPWCDACGELGAGDTVQVYTTAEWFGVRVPVLIHFDRERGGLEVAVSRAKPDSLVALDVQLLTARRYDGPDTTFTIQLYDRAVGGTVRSLSITPATPVALHRVYAVVGISDPDSTTEDLTGRDAQILVDVRRLEITLDGRHGFVEPRAFEALGLHILD